MTTIHLDRMLKATIDRVYDDWTRPELLSRWYGPNPDLELKVEADVRVGGETSSRWPHVVRGTYTELEHPRLIAFRWRWDGTPAGFS
jgi:uncharacterized protein YndB with AHSA1/START domain